MNIESKIQKFIDDHCAQADSSGRSSFSTCDCLSYGWDRDIWAFKDQIMSAIRKRGYSVSHSFKYGVMDVAIVKQLELK